LRPPRPPPRPAQPSRGASPKMVESSIEEVKYLQEIEQTEIDWVRQKIPFRSVPRCFSWCAYWSDRATAAGRPDQYGNRPRIYELTRNRNRNNDCRAYRARSDAAAPREGK
jgi:hypothetical protein